MKISDLKCWPGYRRVKNKKAGTPGSCAKAEGYDPAASNSSAPTIGDEYPISPVGSISKSQRKK